MGEKVLAPAAVVEQDDFLAWVREGLDKYDALIQVRVTDSRGDMPAAILVTELAHSLRKSGAFVTITETEEHLARVLRIGPRLVW